jgi:ribosomal protein S18 acetylase RimI-like enzyme
VGTATIRPITPDEYAVVAELTAGTYRREGYGSPQYEPALRDVASRDATAHVLVADLDGRIVGAVTVATRGGPWSEQAAPGEAEIRMLVVDPAARGTGTGTALVTSCIDLAGIQGCTAVRLSTEPTMTTAHRLYERLGFVRTPERDWEPIPGVTLLTYVLDLSWRPTARSLKRPRRRTLRGC